MLDFQLAAFVSFPVVDWDLLDIYPTKVTHRNRRYTQQVQKLLFGQPTFVVPRIYALLEAELLAHIKPAANSHGSIKSYNMRKNAYCQAIITET